MPLSKLNQMFQEKFHFSFIDILTSFTSKKIDSLVKKLIFLSSKMSINQNTHLNTIVIHKCNDFTSCFQSLFHLNKSNEESARRVCDESI